MRWQRRQQQLLCLRLRPRLNQWLGACASLKQQRQLSCRDPISKLSKPRLGCAIELDFFSLNAFLLYPSRCVPACPILYQTAIVCTACYPMLPKPICGCLPALLSLEGEQPLLLYNSGTVLPHLALNASPQRFQLQHIAAAFIMPILAVNIVRSREVGETGRIMLLLLLEVCARWPPITGARRTRAA